MAGFDVERNGSPWLMPENSADEILTYVRQVKRRVRLKFRFRPVVKSLFAAQTTSKAEHGAGGF